MINQFSFAYINSLINPLNYLIQQVASNPWITSNLPITKDINRASADYQRHSDIQKNANGRSPKYSDWYELNGVQNLAGYGVNSALGGATRAVAMAHDLTDLYGADVTEDLSYAKYRANRVRNEEFSRMYNKDFQGRFRDRLDVKRTKYYDYHEYMDW